MIDVAIAGASDAVLSEFAVGAFDRIGACSRRNEDYSMTPQPFDKNRDGLVIGEGAGALVLESETHARARGAEIFAEFAGYGTTSDAYHITAPHVDGEGAGLPGEEELVPGKWPYRRLVKMPNPWIILMHMEHQPF